MVLSNHIPTAGHRPERRHQELALRPRAAQRAEPEIQARGVNRHTEGNPIMSPVALPSIQNRTMPQRGTVSAGSPGCASPTSAQVPRPCAGRSPSPARSVEAPRAPRPRS